MNKKQNKFKNTINRIEQSGFIYLLIANILIQISAFGGQIFLTRFINVEDIGTLKIYQSYVNIFVVVVSVGLTTSILKISSEDISEKDRISIFNLSFITIIVTSISIYFLIIILRYAFNLFDNLFVLYAIVIPFISLTNLFIIFMQSQQLIKKMSLIQTASKLIIIFFSTLFAIFYGLNGYIYSMVLLNIITFFAITSFMKEYINFISIAKIKKVLINRIINISKFAWGANLLGVLIANINILIATSMNISRSEIAYYGIAHLIITALMIFPSSLGQIMTPKISRVSNDFGKVKRIMKVYQKINFIMVLCLSLIAAITAPILIPLVFGQSYYNSVFIFEILILGYIFWSVFSPKGITLMSVGRSDINFFVSLITLILLFISSFTFINMYGIIGAAIATTVTNFMVIRINHLFLNIFYFNSSKQ